MTVIAEYEALFWQELDPNLKFVDILETALQNAAHGLSEMVGRPITIDTAQVESIPIGQVPAYIGAAETEMAAIYLLIEGDMNGQVILMMSLPEAFHLVDLLMGQPTGTTTSLDELGLSALAETGNLTTAYFLNQVAKLTGTSVRPSPPAVMVDMLGAILNVITSPLAMVSDHLMIVETTFKELERTVTAYFWVLPNPSIDYQY